MISQAQMDEMYARNMEMIENIKLLYGEPVSKILSALANQLLSVSVLIRMSGAKAGNVAAMLTDSNVEMLTAVAEECGWAAKGLTPTKIKEILEMFMAARRFKYV